ncbi:MAG: hypothetical protein IKL49_01080 [Lachnospiraceae bacterium]|nr:hypothetical protein [Lachnospiraceae bacterium]
MSSQEYIEEMFPFDKPLTSRHRKDFVEYLSLEILKYCYNDTYINFFVVDKPDIQNSDKIVGIEVTEAISREDAQIEGEFVKYRIKNDANSKIRSKAIIEANGGKMDELSLSYPTKTLLMEKNVFQNVLRNKLKKFKTYKEKGFEKIGLFIYYDEPPIPFRLNDIKVWFDEVLEQYSEKYDWIYFSYPYGIIRYDIKENNIQATAIRREDYNTLQFNARVSVEEKYKKQPQISVSSPPVH